MDEFLNESVKEVAKKRETAATNLLSELRAIGESFDVSLEDICAALLTILDRKFPPPTFEFSVN